MQTMLGAASDPHCVSREEYAISECIAAQDELSQGHWKEQSHKGLRILSLSEETLRRHYPFNGVKKQERGNKIEIQH